MSISPSMCSELWPRDSPVELQRCPYPLCSNDTTLFSPIEWVVHEQEQHPDYALWQDNLNTPPTLSPPQPTPSEITGSDVCLSQSSTAMLSTPTNQDHNPDPVQAKVALPPPIGGSVQEFFFEEPIPSSFSTTVDDIHQVGLVADVESTFIIHQKEHWCVYSPNSKYYLIKSGMDGKMAMDINFKNVAQLEPGETLWITMKLKRNHDNWAAVSVDRVCPLHCQKGAVQHNILPVRGKENDGRYYNDFCPEEGSSVLYYQCLNPIGSDGSLSEAVAVRYPCFDSCQTSSQHKLYEPARDCYMVVQLEKRTADDIRSVLHDFKVNTWLCAQIDAEKLAKTCRRKPKGAAAQQAGKKRRLEAQAAIKTELEDNFDTETWIQQGKRLILAGKITPKEALRRLQAP